MTHTFTSILALLIGFSLAATSVQGSITAETVVGFDQALKEAVGASSNARKRLAIRRIIRDAEELIEANKGKPERFLVLEFLFRAQQQLIAMDKDAKHRAALIDICQELIKAPDEYAHLKFDADLLLSQAELAKEGASNEERAAALRPIVNRYLTTKEGPKVLRVTMVMALELGDAKLVADLRELIAIHYPADYEMINFQRDKLGGQVFGAPFAGNFKRSDGKMICYPMDGLGRSLMVLFWSKDNNGMAYAKGLAETYLKRKEELTGRIEIISINLDELPDAGESIIRGFGADWQCFHLPQGRENPIYKTYARTDPMRLGVSSSGQAALIMEGVSRVRHNEDGSVNFDRSFDSAVAREWTRSRHCAQLCSLMAGDFLVFDPEGFDAYRPPEWKAATMGGKVKPFERAAGSVPEETLIAIQERFVAPPVRYRLSHTEINTNYAKAVQLCRRAMRDHSKAPDLWIVRNRLIIALMGLWKHEGELKYLELAFAESKLALEAGYPPGCDLIARFCLARQALRESGTSSKDVLDQFMAAALDGNETASSLAAASMLALDVADRASFIRYRDIILQQHIEEPMSWLMSSFLLDRYHHYWLFQVPFTAGWSYARREGYFQTMGDVEDANRHVKAEFKADDGKPFRIPEDLSSEMTLILFAPSPPWSAKKDDGLPGSPQRTIGGYAGLKTSRPQGNFDVILALFDGNPAQVRSSLGKGRYGVDCPVITVPHGLSNPLVHQLGILSEDRQINALLLNKEGRVLAMVSGLAKLNAPHYGSTIHNVIACMDELKVIDLLERGEIDQAKKYILSLAPVYDPEAVDERGRKLRKPNYGLAHLRARARALAACKEWGQALADAELATSKQLSKEGGMSLRTDELDRTEALRDSIKQQMEAQQK